MTNPSPDTLGQYLAANAQRELETLRAELDVRLLALETALARPDPHISLEKLILDLARVATAEAQSAAVRASLEAQLHAQQRGTDTQHLLDEERATTTTLRFELEQARTMLEGEREAAARLRRAHDEARKALEEERLASVDAARDLDALKHELQTAHSATAEANRRVDAFEQALKQERARGAALDGQVAEHRDRAAKLSDSLGATTSELAAAQRSIDARAEGEAASRRRLEGLEHALHDEQSRRAALESALAQERAAAEQRAESVAALERDLTAAQELLDAQAGAGEAQRAVVERLENRCVELDQQYNAATARVTEAVGERDGLADALEAERRSRAAERESAAATQVDAEAQKAAVDAGRTSAEQARNDAEWRAKAASDAREQAEARAKAASDARDLAEARTKKASDERDALAASLEIARTEAAATEAAAEARIADIDARRADAERNWNDAEARAEALGVERDELRALLDAAKESVQGMRAEVETRLTALETKRTRTMEALEDAEARAEAATRARDALAAELETLRQTAGHDPEMEARLAAATERIRVLELELFERDRGPRDRDIELGSLIDVKPSPPSDQAGKRATRHAFKPTAKVKVDRDPGVLIDLSVTGAQVVMATSPDVGEIVKLSLLSEEAPCFCEGRLLWARREQTAKGKPFRYRAGIVFTAADEAAIEAFIARHAIS